MSTAYNRMLQQLILSRRAAGQPYLERNVLVILSDAVLSNAPIDPNFQALANAIVARIIVTGELPLRQKGRRKGIKGHDPAMVTTEFFELVDGVGSPGMTESEAKLELALLWDLDFSTITRAVESERMWHGDSRAAREQARKSDELLGVNVLQAEVEETGLVELAGLEKDEALAQLQATIQLRSHGTS